MIGLVWQIGIYLALWAWQKYMTVKPPGPANAKVQQPSLPHTEEGAPIPIFWGSVRITGPAIVFARRFHADPISQEIGGDNVIVGYRYLLAMQFVLGAPGGNYVAPTKPSKLSAFFIGERLVWGGTIDTDNDIRQISKRLLLGGDNAGGGVKGIISYLPGSFSQTNNVFLKELLLGSGANTDLCYRGQAVVTLFGITGMSWGNDGLAYTGNAAIANLAGDNTPCGFMVGETPNLDGYSFTAFAPTTCSLDSTIVNPIGNDANPICVIYDIITNPWDRVGRDASTVDEESFLAAALTLKAEGHGFSLIIPGTMDSREAIGLVLEQIDGVLYDDATTGKMRIALVREDYDVDDLDTLDPSNVLEVVSYSAGTWSSTINQVRIIYSDRAKKGQDAPAIAQDQANFYATGSKIRSRDIKYPGCTLKTLADKLASRELKALSLPLAKLRIAVDRSAYAARPGDVFKFSWPEFDNMSEVVFRVIKYDLGKLGDERVILDCVQDRWAFKHTVFHAPQGNVVVTSSPALPTDTHHSETPWWLGQRAQQVGRIVDATVGGRWIYLAAPRRESALLHSVAMHAEVSATSAEDDYAPDIEPQPYPGRAYVAVDYTRELEPYDTTTGLVIHTVEDWTPAAASASDIKLFGKNLILVGTAERHEYMTYETATDNGDGTWTLGNVGRAALDTAAIAHDATRYLIELEGYFVASDENNDEVLVTVPAGSYTGAELVALIVPQLPSSTDPTWTFQIVDGYAEFNYTGSILDVTWDTVSPPNPVRDTGSQALRVALGFAADDDAADYDSAVDGPYTGSRPVALDDAGARVWAVHGPTGAAVTRIGRVAFDYAQTHTNRLGARGVGLVVVGSAAPTVDRTTVQTLLRFGRPYPVADLNIGCSSLVLADTPSKTPAQLVEDGIDLTWKRRDRLSETIKRGDLADEDPEFDVRYKVIGRTRGEDGEINNVAILVNASQPYTTVSYDGAPLGAAGYGLIEAGVRAEAPLRANNPAAPHSAANWFDNVIEIDAPHWRNLVINGRFDRDLDGWTTDAGDPVVEDAEQLGSAGFYLTGGDEDDVQVSQLLKVAANGADGYVPGNLTATCHFYHHNTNSDTDDEVEVTVESLDSGFGLLDSATSGVIVPSSSEWTHASFDLDDLDPLTSYLRVTVYLTGHGGGPQSAVTEVIVRLGESTDQLLLNPDFETVLPSVFTNWTNVTNSFVSSTSAPLYVKTRYARPGNFASSEIRQDVTIPNGWQVGATAVLELGRANTAIETPADTGEVIIEARDLGGTVLASETTGAEHITLGGWERRRLVLEIPPGSVTIRTRLLGTRNTGTTCDTAFDDLDLRLYKELDPVNVQTIEVDVPASQPVPPDYDYFDRAWPDIPPPSLAFYQGGSFVGARGTEPELVSQDDGTATAPATLAGKFTGAYDATQGGAVVHEALDFPPGCDAGFEVADSSFAAFTSDDSFTAVVMCKSGLETCTLVGRIGTTGWELRFDGGAANARMIGADGSIDVTSATDIVGDWSMRVVGLIYDAVAQTLSVVTELGTETTSTVGIGEIEDTTATTLKIGAPTEAGGEFLEGQIARVWLWDEALLSADVETMISVGDQPQHRLFQERVENSVIATVVGSDDDGVVVSRFNANQYAFAFAQPLEDDGGTGLGFPFQLPAKNRITTDMQRQDAAGWVTVGSPTVELNYGATVEGNVASFSVTGSNAEGRELRSITAGTSANKMIAFFARCIDTGTGGHTARVALNNASDVNKGNFDYLATPTWELYWHLFTGWDNSTPTCRLRFCGSDDGTDQQVEICGPFYLSESDVTLVAIPIGDDADTEYGYTGATIDSVGDEETLTYQSSLEGELQVTGVSPVALPFDDAAIIQLSSGGGADFRVLYNSGGSPSFWHYDGGDNFASTPSAEDWSELWTIRGRWNMAGLLDAPTAYTSVVFGSTLSAPLDIGRVAQWTDSGNTPDEIMLGSSEIGDSMPAVYRSFVIRSRERRLPP